MSRDQLEEQYAGHYRGMINPRKKYRDVINQDYERYGDVDDEGVVGFAVVAAAAVVVVEGWGFGGFGMMTMRRPHHRDLPDHAGQSCLGHGQDLNREMKKEQKAWMNLKKTGRGLQ